MSTLRSALDEYREDDLRYRSDEELEDDFAELERAARLLYAERLRRLAEIDRRATYRRDGHLSTSSWFAHRHRVSYQTAARQVRFARALARMPGTRKALASAEISASAADVLVSAREANPAAFETAEESSWMRAEASRSGSSLRPWRTGGRLRTRN